MNGPVRLKDAIKAKRRKKSKKNERTKRKKETQDCCHNPAREPVRQVSSTLTCIIFDTYHMHQEIQMAKLLSSSYGCMTGSMMTAILVLRSLYVLIKFVSASIAQATHRVYIESSADRSSKMVAHNKIQVGAQTRKFPQ